MLVRGTSKCVKKANLNVAKVQLKYNRLIVHFKPTNQEKSSSLVF